MKTGVSAIQRMLSSNGIAILVFFAIISSGCTTHSLNFSSEPPGLPIHFKSVRNEWVKIGETPAEVTMTSAYNPKYAWIGPLDETGLLVQLNPVWRKGMHFAAYSSFAGGVAISIGAGAASHLGGLAVGALFGFGFPAILFDNAFYYDTVSFHFEAEDGIIRLRPTSESVDKPRLSPTEDGKE